MPAPRKRDGFGNRPGLIAKPAGIWRPEACLAGYCDGTVTIMPPCEVVTAVEAIQLNVRIEYARDEVMPRELFLGGRLIVRCIRPPVLPNRTRRCLILSDCDDRILEVWLYLEPERQWAVVNDPRWICGILS